MNRYQGFVVCILLVCLAAPVGAAEFSILTDVRQINNSWASAYLDADGGQGEWMATGDPWDTDLAMSINSLDGLLGLTMSAGQVSTPEPQQMYGTCTATAGLITDRSLSGTEINSSTLGDSYYWVVFEVTEATQVRLDCERYTLEATEYGLASVSFQFLSLGGGEPLFEYADSVTDGFTIGEFESDWIALEPGTAYMLKAIDIAEVSIDTAAATQMREQAEASFDFGLTMVPEPTTCALFGIGGLAFLRRRR